MRGVRKFTKRSPDLSRAYPQRRNSRNLHLDPPSAENQNLAERLHRHHRRRLRTEHLNAVLEEDGRHAVNRRSSRSRIFPDDFKLGRIRTGESDTLAHPDPCVRAALVYINHNMRRSFGTPEIAKSIEITRHRLDRLFAERLGHSVGAEIHSRRMACVKHMLEDPSKTVNAIAAECGFCNVAYLSNVFRRETRLSPRAWRAAAADRRAHAKAEKFHGVCITPCR